MSSVNNSINANSTSPLPSSQGGTGVSNTGTWTNGGNVSFVGAHTFAGTLSNNTAVTFPTTGTLATTAQIPAGAALTKTDDTNVTLTLGGSPTTALVNAASIAAGWTGLLSPARGGTGVNNGTSTITVGGNTAFSGAFTFTGTVTGNTAVTFPTSGTLSTATAASQSDQETGTSNTVFVTPGVQQYHPSASKMWVSYTSITTTAIRASYNVTSLTDLGVGNTKINFTVAFSSVNYSVVGGSNSNTGSAGQGAFMFSPNTGDVGAVQYTPTTLAVADGIVSVVAYGDQ